MDAKGKGKGKDTKGGKSQDAKGKGKDKGNKGDPSLHVPQPAKPAAQTAGVASQSTGAPPQTQTQPSPPPAPPNGDNLHPDMKRLPPGVIRYCHRETCGASHESAVIVTCRHRKNKTIRCQGYVGEPVYPSPPGEEEEEEDDTG